MRRSAQIGAYRILRLINTGGQGTVYLGFDDRLHRKVAIKIYRLPKKKLLRRQVLREAQLVASIESPKVVQIYDLVVAQDHIALIMEYVAGCDLQEFLEHGAPSIASILTICTEVTAALAVARQQHIVHGDLKASNILISQRGRVKLTDFGIARIADSADPETSLQASIVCVSPEQYLGKPLDIRSDLFALGCLLYRMLTGRHPFVHKGELNAEKLLRGQPQPARQLVSPAMALPAGLLDLLCALLQKLPEDRPDNTHEVRNTLRAISRQIPLAVGNTLLQESKAYFRVESRDEIPPQIPGDLARNGRSRLGRSSFVPEFVAYNMPLAITGLVLLAMVGGVLVQFFLRSEQRIVIETPSFIIATEAELPKELSPAWLVVEIERVLSLRTKSTVVIGSQVPRAFVSKDISAVSHEQRHQSDLHLLPQLHCVDDLCLLELVLEKGGEKFYQQKLIFSSMPIARWSDGVQSATRVLLDQSG